MTLRGLAEKVKISPPFLSDIEHNRRRTDKLDLLATALEVEVQDLNELDGRLPQDLQDWIKNNPSVVALLQDLRSSGREASEVRAMLSRRRR